MSPQQVRVASLLLEETFGPLVERVGSHLVRHGALPISDIVKGTGMKQIEVGIHTNMILKVEKVPKPIVYVRSWIVLCSCRSSEVCASLCNITLLRACLTNVAPSCTDQP